MLMRKQSAAIVQKQNIEPVSRIYGEVEVGKLCLKFCDSLRHSPIPIVDTCPICDGIDLLKAAMTGRDLKNGGGHAAAGITGWCDGGVVSHPPVPTNDGGCPICNARKRMGLL
jgi:hypothetical protein